MTSSALLAVHNLIDQVVEIELQLRGDAGKKLVSLFDHARSEADRGGRHRLILEPYGYLWYRMGGLGYLLDRSDT